MRVLYACRLFTGFEHSLFTGKWAPTGVPTIYKMIEALDREAEDVRFVMTCKDAAKDAFSSWSESRDRTLEVDRLKHPVLVLAGANRFPAALGGARRYLRELRHIWRIWVEV